jgi:hypothetical protein
MRKLVYKLVIREKQTEIVKKSERAMKRTMWTGSTSAYRSSDRDLEETHGK